MRKLVLITVVLFAIFAQYSDFCLGQNQELVFYVSTDGSDSNPGTREKPFVSVEQAQRSVREKIATGLTQDITIRIRGGMYPLDKPLYFDDRDSGTGQYSVTYQAYPGETPIFSGGRQIGLKRWTHVTGDLWTCEVPDVATGQWWFRDLYANNERQIRARYPNQDYSDHLEFTGYLKSEDEEFKNRGLCMPVHKEYFLEVIGFKDSERKHLIVNQRVPEGNWEEKNTELVVLNNWTIHRALLKESHGNELISQ
jgi:hypothetical protein